MGGKRRLKTGTFKVRPKMETITPDDARKILEDTDQVEEFRNRRLMQSRVDAYAREIKAGNWSSYNGKTISIDTRGACIDGQHRLWAIIEADTPVEALVVRGCDPDSFTTIDVGAGRTPGHIFHTLGVPNANGVAAAVGWLYRYRRESMSSDTSLSNSGSREELRRLFEQEPQIAEGSHAVSAVKKVLPPSVAFMCYHVFAQDQHVEAADEFFEKLGSGAELKKTDPIYALRERLLASKAEPKKRGLKVIEKFALTFKAWQMWVDEVPCRSVRALQWRRGSEQFPYLDNPTQKRKRKARKRQASRRRKAG